MKDYLIDYSIRTGLEKAWKWKFWITGACVAAGLISIFLSLRMKNEFRSISAFVPPAFGSLSSMVFNNGSGYKGFESAGEIDIDRTVDYLNNIQLIDSVARKYNLYDHYNINPKKDKSEKDKLFYFLFSKKNSIHFSDRSTIVIECYDEDPQIASDIANTYLQFAIDFFESISERKKGFQATVTKLEELKQQRINILDTLSMLRTRYKIYHYDYAGDAIDRIIARQMETNPEFHKAYDKVISSEIQMKLLEERISDMEREYTSRKLNLDQYDTLIQVVQRAQPSYYKARPKRSYIVIGAVAATFLFSIFVVLMIDRKRTTVPI